MKLLGKKQYIQFKIKEQVNKYYTSSISLLEINENIKKLHPKLYVYPYRTYRGYRLMIMGLEHI